MDKAERFMARRAEAENWLANEPDFVATSSHPSWQGKVKCRYCKSAGWPWKPGITTWWGKNHGKYCKWKELWLLKQQQRNQVNITYSTNTNWNGNWYVGSTGNAFFRGRI